MTAAGSEVKDVADQSISERYVRHEEPAIDTTTGRSDTESMTQEIPRPSTPPAPPQVTRGGLSTPRNPIEDGDKPGPSTPPPNADCAGEAKIDVTDATPNEELFLPQQHVTQTELLKWNDMMREPGISKFSKVHPDRFLRRVRRGIPPQFRWQVWKAAVRLHEHEHILAQDYQSLSQQEHEWTNVIEIDIARTFPELKSFAQDQQRMLWRVLNAYAAYNPKLGYCQGMNFVAGLLLLVSEFQEEESFGVLVCLMDNCGLAGFYGDRLPLFKRYLRACDTLVQETVPDLRDHFKKENVHAAVYLHQWFLTLFINCFPLSMVIIIWDAIVCEGLEVVLRIAVSILQVLKDSLLAMQFEEIIKFFKMMKTYDDEDSELNAFRIGQLLMKHTELVKVPQHILDELRSDAADDDAQFDAADDSWDVNRANSGTWFSGFGRFMSYFNYGTPRAVRSVSDSSFQSSNAGADNASAGDMDGGYFL